MLEIKSPKQLGIIPTDAVDDFISIVATSNNHGHGTSSSTIGSGKNKRKLLQLSFGDQKLRKGPDYFLFECGNHFHCYIDEVAELGAIDRVATFKKTILKLQEGDEKYEWKTSIVISGLYGNLYTLTSPIHLTDSLGLSPAGLRFQAVTTYRPLEPFNPQDIHPPEEKIRGGASGRYNSKFELAVEGYTRGRTWATASVATSELISKLAAYLSVQFDLVIELDESLICKSEFAAAFGQNTVERKRVKSLENAEPLNIDDRMINNWGFFEKNKTLTDSFEMFAEGIRIEKEHPSLAHIAYVASIERIGTDITPPKECAGLHGDNTIHCENCIRIKGASAAFKSALRLTMSQSKAKQFMKQSYGKRRSKTVHEAVLHGAENKRGSSMHHSMVDDYSYFNFEVGRVREIARAILLEAIEKRIVAVEKNV